MDDSSTSKRRRGLGIVTPNACTECRKKRAKCDGHQPCGRCATQKGVDCIYEVPVRQSKEHMRIEIETLRSQQQRSERVLAALVSEEKSGDVLERLRNGETLETVSARLDKEKGKKGGSGDHNTTTYARPSDHHAIGGALKATRSVGSSPLSNLAFSDTYEETLPAQEPGTWTGWEGGAGTSSNQSQHEDMMRWSPEAGPSHHGLAFPLVGTWHHPTDENMLDSTTRLLRDQGRVNILGQEFSSEEHQYAEAWTEITQDEELVEHLMALYFCWEYPTFASLSKEHFLEDFRLGRRRHCSSLLVNAILAVGCRFSTQEATRTVSTDSNTAGDHFFAEALKILLQEEDRHKLTTVQALGLMSIREASCGRSSDGIYYSGQSIRLAIEMGLHMESESGGGDDATLEHAVRSATFWGAFSLDQCWSLCIGRLPHFSRDTNLIAKPAIVVNVEASPWIPYTDNGAPLERNCTQPSNVRSVYKTFCELSEIVHRAHYTFYTPGVKLSGKSLLDIYTRYLRWYDSIPEVLRLGHNFTPSVLFVHMYYHFAILLLFRPFIKLEIVGSAVSPRDVCSQAADAITALVNSYAQLYTLRRTPSFVPYFVLAAGISHLVAFGTGTGGPEHIHRGIEDLKTMADCHGFATRARDILRFLADRWGVQIVLDHSDGGDPKVACLPKTTSLNQFCPNIESVDLASNINPYPSSIDPTQTTVENPLFYAFPLQGRPLLGSGGELEKAGFRSLSAVE